MMAQARPIAAARAPARRSAFAARPRPRTPPVAGTRLRREGRSSGERRLIGEERRGGELKGEGELCLHALLGMQKGSQQRLKSLISYDGHGEDNRLFEPLCKPNEKYSFIGWVTAMNTYKSFIYSLFVSSLVLPCKFLDSFNNRYCCYSSSSNVIIYIL